MIIPRLKHAGINVGEIDPETDEIAGSLMFGFWIFLMADLVIFSLLFATYAAMSVNGVASGPGPAALFDLKTPFLETMVLLASSFTFGYASISLKYDRKPGPVYFWLILTGLLGAAFVGMEIFDFRNLIVAHHAGPQVSGFLSAYFLLVGTHGAHVTAATIWLVIMLVQVAALGLTKEVKLRIMRLALFWHMLDIVWVGIFTFVYLYGYLS